MTKQQIRRLAENVATSHFYTEDACPWEPFENYDEKWIDEQVQSLADSIENAINYAMKGLL